MLGVPDSVPVFGWRRHILRRDVRTRTTWLFRLGLALTAAVGLWLTAALWTRAIGWSLVCTHDVKPSAAVLIENFDPEYLLFERARGLRQAGIAARVLVPIRIDHQSGNRNAVAMGVADVMARISRIGSIETIPIREVEPISLNAAVDVRRYLQQHGIRSVVLVAPLFRSRRSALVYRAVLASAGIAVGCDVSDGQRAVERWPGTWHGVQNVVEQWVKLQYYRFVVIPFLCCLDDAENAEQS